MNIIKYKSRSREILLSQPSITHVSHAKILSTFSPRLFARSNTSNMKFSTSLAMSVALASTSQACVRILVNEVWGDTREITLWDQDSVSDLRLPFKETTGNDDIWQGNGYTVAINKQTTGGSVTYPNGYCKSAAFPPQSLETRVSTATENR